MKKTGLAFWAYWQTGVAVYAILEASPLLTRNALSIGCSGGLLPFHPTGTAVPYHVAAGLTWGRVECFAVLAFHTLTVVDAVTTSLLSEASRTISAPRTLTICLVGACAQLVLKADGAALPGHAHSVVELRARPLHPHPWRTTAAQQAHTTADLFVVTVGHVAVDSARAIQEIRRALAGKTAGGGRPRALEARLIARVALSIERVVS